MQLNDKGEVVWVPVNPELVQTYRAGIVWHLYNHMDRVLTEETDDERR